MDESEIKVFILLAPASGVTLGWQYLAPRTPSVSVSLATIKNDHKLSGLKQKSIFSQFWVSEVQNQGVDSF